MKGRILASVVCVFLAAVFGYVLVNTVIEPPKDSLVYKTHLFLYENMPTIGLVVTVVCISGGVLTLLCIALWGIWGGRRASRQPEATNRPAVDRQPHWYLANRLLVTAPQDVDARQEGEMIILSIPHPCEIGLGVEDPEQRFKGPSPVEVTS